MSLDHEDATRIRRSVLAMSVAQIEAHEERRKRDAYEGLQEFDQQFQFPMRGTATAVPVWSNVELEFDAIFVDAPDQRETPYRNPQYTWGFEGVGDVFLAVNLLRWHRRFDESFKGVTLRVGVHKPFQLDPSPFSGTVHVNFQGYGSVAMPQGDPE